jgi:putative flavoprotein involved in K+ transport
MRGGVTTPTQRHPSEHVETVIIGGGQAGLALSACLGQLGREHVVLERGRLAERWRSERWDSLTLLSPNWMTQLPGFGYDGNDPDGFVGRDAVVQLLEDYAAAFQAPLRCGVNVTSVQPQTGVARYLVHTTDLARGTTTPIAARNVVVATGAFQHPRIPPLSATLPAGLVQLSSRDYRNPAQLPPGAVLVVGSGGSGSQIADELCEHGRRVYLSVGRCQRWPRRYRGRDIWNWLRDMGILDAVGRRHYLVDASYGCTAVLTGVRGGYDLDYDRFANAGVTLVGHLRGYANGTLHLADDLHASLERWDESRAIMTGQIDAYIQHVGLDAPPEDARDGAAARAWRARPPILDLDLATTGITTILWATGFGLDFSWLGVPVLDDRGDPVQHRGVTASPGVYFLGLRRMYTVKSSFLFGVGEDAAYLAEHIAANT